MIIAHVQPDDDPWKDYEFMYSLSFIADKAYKNIFKSYTKLLRTDLDVFVTPALLHWKTDKLQVGKGQYIRMDYTRNHLYNISEELGLRNQKIHNTGSTWYGDPGLVIDLIQKAIEISEYLLDKKFGKDTVQGWPIWHRGVTSMYAQELAINHLVDKDSLNINEFSMDAMSNEKIPISDVYHIHCWYRPEQRNGSHSWFFWKEDFMSGKYLRDSYPKDSLNMSLVSDYSLSLALYGA